MLQVQIICKQLCSAELLLGHTGLGDWNTERLPPGEREAAGKRNTNRGERLRRKDNSFQIFSFVFFLRNLVEISREVPSARLNRGLFRSAALRCLRAVRNAKRTEMKRIQALAGKEVSLCMVFVQCTLCGEICKGARGDELQLLAACLP